MTSYLNYVWILHLSSLTVKQDVIKQENFIDVNLQRFLYKLHTISISEISLELLFFWISKLNLNITF